MGELKEMLDVLDENGDKTDKVLSRGEVHENGLWHASVFVWIYNSKGEVIVQKRAENKKVFPGKWDISVAGHVGAGELPEQAVIRECSEELDLRIKENEIKHVKTVNLLVPTVNGDSYHERCWIYLIKKDVGLTELDIQKEELSGVNLMSVEAIINKIKHPEQAKDFAIRDIEIYREPFNIIKKVVANS